MAEGDETDDGGEEESENSTFSTKVRFVNDIMGFMRIWKLLRPLWWNIQWAFKGFLLDVFCCRNFFL